MEVLDKTMDNYDARQIPEVRFSFESEVQPGEIEFFLRIKEEIKKMMKENVSSEDMDRRLKEMGLLKFKGKLGKEEIKIISKKDYCYFFPEITPISVKNYTNTVRECSQICYSLYHNWLLKYLINKLKLKKYDDLFFYSDLKFRTISPKNMDIYQYLASNDLKYFYLRNNLHLDNLFEEELDFLVRVSTGKDYDYDDEKEKFVESTYQKVIFDDILGNNQIVNINYGPESGSFFAPNNAIVIGFRYNELYNIGMTDDEWDELHDKQITALNNILNLFDVEAQNALHVPHQIIIFNEFSVKKR